MVGLRSIVALGTAVLVFGTASLAQAQEQDEQEGLRWSLAIHGGAGTLDPERLTPELRAEYEAALQDALDRGSAILASGGSAIEAVKAAILPLENSPLFNAGRGAVYTWDGTHELDASIMDGRDRSAGAVAGVSGIKNPILLAEAVRNHGRHVLLSGDGAETFAAEQGIETAPPEWFATERRRNALEELKTNEVSALAVDAKFGTVGAVALDQAGNLAAGTSTGGMTGKRWNRIGDSPIIGAGTYADNRSCAVSATGWGEFFIRVGVAQEICTRLRLLNGSKSRALYDDVRTAAGAGALIVSPTPPLNQREVQTVADGVMAEVKKLGGDGGVIVVTPDAHAIYSFNTAGMYRGRVTSAGLNEVAIFEGE